MTEQQELEILLAAFTKAELARMYLMRLKEKEEIEHKTTLKIFDRIDELRWKCLDCDITDKEFWEKLYEFKKETLKECTGCKYFVGCEQANWIRGCESYTEAHNGCENTKS